ncbi:hypothetical protein [Paenibacillus arenilitoris]|uniref:Uncharacterized protein n=1 Tax=Paenibacillus arenilitoris TaxID=2772299 RepID=A0A927CM44_9BACL|nr:hypothetical protein [Paenibacillus arenilitoris]MBD2869940.1 hypothetical protein [Paenibacillus arenilitoris]
MRYRLYHYFETGQGPFRNLSSLPLEEARQVSARLRSDGGVFASRRSVDYVEIRRELEGKARDSFIAKGGRPLKRYPHYMTLGECEWLREWYKHSGRIVIELDRFKEEAVSFTYGDLFPTMRYKDGKPYREQVYTKSEIMELILTYGLPQQWNGDGSKGPERYIEAQIWDDEIIGPLIGQKD